MLTVLPHVTQLAQRRLVESAMPNTAPVEDTEPKLVRLLALLLRAR
jgi:hypothetical protein